MRRQTKYNPTTVTRDNTQGVNTAPVGIRPGSTEEEEFLAAFGSNERASEAAFETSFEHEYSQLEDPYRNKPNPGYEEYQQLLLRWTEISRNSPCPASDSVTVVPLGIIF